MGELRRSTALSRSPSRRTSKDVVNSAHAARTPRSHVSESVAHAKRNLSNPARSRVKGGAFEKARERSEINSSDAHGGPWSVKSPTTFAVGTKGSAVGLIASSRLSSARQESAMSSSKMHGNTASECARPPVSRPSSSSGICRCGLAVAAYCDQSAWICDRCDRHSIHQTGRYRCAAGCNYDLCARCAGKGDHASGVLSERRVPRHQQQLSRCVEDVPVGYHQIPDVERLVILDGLRRRKSQLEQATGYAYGACGNWSYSEGPDQALYGHELRNINRRLQEFSKPRVLIKC